MRAARARIRVQIGGKLVDAADLPLLFLPAEIAEAEGLGILGDRADGLVGESRIGGVLGLDLHGHVEPHVGLLSEPADDLVDDLRELGDRAPRIRQGDLAVEAPDAADRSRLGPGPGAGIRRTARGRTSRAAASAAFWMVGARRIAPP